MKLHPVGLRLLQLEQVHMKFLELRLLAVVD